MWWPWLLCLRTRTSFRLMLNVLMNFCIRESNMRSATYQMNVDLNIWFPWYVGSILSKWAAISSWRVTLFHGVSYNFLEYRSFRRSQWPRGLRRGSAAASLMGLWVRIPQGALMSVSCACCVVSGRGLCDELVLHPEESYRLWCDREASKKWGGLGPQGAVEPLKKIDHTTDACKLERIRRKFSSLCHRHFFNNLNTNMLMS